MSDAPRLTKEMTTPRPTLDALLACARNHVMTTAERIAQRRSWVKGEFMIEHPDMPEAEVDALLDRTLPELAPKEPGHG